MKKNHYTIRTLAAKMGKTHPSAASLIRRMKRDGLAELAEAMPLNAQNTKTKVHVYNLLIDPEEYLNGVRAAKIRVPKSGFFNNPFKLKGAVDARYATD
jgi:hypothetical protein